MERKIVYLLMAFAVALAILSGCGATAKADSPANDFRIVSKVSNVYMIVYDTDTNVMYVVSDGTYNDGTFTMLVNADGTPKIYKGE